MMKKQQQCIETYKRLLKSIAPYWFIFVCGTVSTILLSTLDASFAWLMKPLINKGFIHRDAYFIQWLPILLVIIFILRGLSGFASNYLICRIARFVVMDFRCAIFNHLLKLPADFYDRHSSGRLLSRIIYNVEQIATASSSALIILLREGSLLISLVIVMFIVNWRLSLVFLTITPVVAWVIKKCSYRLKVLSTNVQKAMGEVTHTASETIDGYKNVRLYGGQSYEKNKFVNATRTNCQRELKVAVTDSIGSALIQILIAIPISTILFFATMPSLKISAGSFSAVLSSMIFLLRPVRRMSIINSQIQKGIAGAESVFNLLDESVEKDQGTLILTRAQGSIEFSQVNFSYPNTQKPTLSNITFKVKPGKMVAIVGRSGSGKSTLVNLLPRFYETESGAIKIDGHDISDYRLQDLRQQFSFVSQNTILFNDTILKNIAYANAKLESIDELAVIKAAESAHAMEFIERLPDGLRTIVGQNGLLLSGGQRQRIAIARALFKKAPILILDEATSDLDAHAERHIQKSLDNLMQQQQCTTLVIAHRLSTIEHADWIIVIDQGKIIEQGTQLELLTKNEAYAQLHRMQFLKKKVEE